MATRRKQSRKAPHPDNEESEMYEDDEMEEGGVGGTCKLCGAKKGTCACESSGSLGEERTDGLVGFPEHGKPKPRVKDMKSLHGVYLKFCADDELAAYNRSLVRDAADGAPPYPNSSIENEGRFNLNFHDLSAIMDERNGVYTDLIESVPNLARFSFPETMQEDNDIIRKQNIIEEEFTQLNRSDWSEFYSNWDLLVNEMAQHGVALVYAPDELTWKWEAAGLDDFMVSKKAKARESAVDVMFIRGVFSVDTMYRMIKEEPVAKGAGWNIASAKRAMVRASRGLQGSANGYSSSWAGVRADLDADGVSNAYYKATDVRVVHVLVKEYESGAYSHYIMPEDGDGEDFLFFRNDRYLSDKDCFTIFTARIGRNGRYNSIRGDLYRAYPEAQALNRLRCAALDSTAHSMSIMLQPTDSESMEDMAIMLNGPITVLPPEANVITERVHPNLQNNAVPMIKDMTSTMRENLGMMRPANIDFANTQYGQQVQSMALGALTGAQVSRFYRSLKRVFEMQVDRIKRIGPMDPRFPEIAQFYARLAYRGVQPEEFLMVERIEPYRAAGNGSVGHRLAAFTQGIAQVGSLDEVGRHRFLLGYFSELFGRDIALQFVGQQETSRYVIDTKIAGFENTLIKEDPSIVAQPGENNFVHSQIHIQFVVSTVATIEEALRQPEVDPTPHLETIMWMGGILGHTEKHIEAMAMDVSRQRDYMEFRKVFQQTMAKVIALRDLAVQLTPTDQERQEKATRMQLEQEAHQVKLQVMQEEAQQRMAISMQEAQQRMRLREREGTKGGGFSPSPVVAPSPSAMPPQGSPVIPAMPPPLGQSVRPMLTPPV